MPTDRPALATLRPILIDRFAAAAVLSVSARTVARLTASGELPSVLVETRRLYSVRALRTWARTKEHAGALVTT